MLSAAAMVSQSDGKRPVAFAAALNTTRDHFLHWQPGRPVHPAYEGLDITTETGFKAAMDAALLFLQRMPFQIPD